MSRRRRPRGDRSWESDPAYLRAKKRMATLPCELCGAPPPSTVDHIIPRRFGGTNAPDNLRPLCRSCNSRGGGHISGLIKRTRASRRHTW